MNTTEYPITIFGKTYNSEQDVIDETKRQDFKMKLMLLLPKGDFERHREALYNAKPDRYESIIGLLSMGANVEGVVEILQLPNDLFLRAVSDLTGLYGSVKRVVTAQELRSLLPTKKENIKQRVNKLIKRTK